LEELRNRTLIITEKSFPFREAYNHRPGRLKVYHERYIDRHYGHDKCYDEGYMSAVNTVIGTRMVNENYDIVQGVFVIKMLHPSVIRFIKLRWEHRASYNSTEMLKVYMVATYKVKTGYLVLYVPDYELRPQIPVLVDEPQVISFK